MIKKYISVVLLVGILTVVAVGISAIEPQKADAATSVKTCDGGTIQLNSDEKQILDLQNLARTSRGKTALCVHPDLTEAARYHSKDMLDNNYSSHTSPDGETVKERLERFGYTFDGCSYYVYGENIAWGAGDSYADPNYIFKWWMHSKAHRHNILKDSFQEVGIGVQTGTYQTYTKKTYTVDFGTRR